MLDKPNIFNIPANYDFFESIFFWLEKNFSKDISKAKIFLPNRRSCRELRQLFLQKNVSGILPQIKAISDISFEDFFEFLPNEDARAAIDEIMQMEVLSGIDYLFFLTEEIQKLSVFGKDLDFSQAFKIALRLRDLFDEIEREEIDLKKLDEIDDSNLSKHRLLTLDFLKNFYVQIKNSLLKKNIFFATSQQNFVISKFIKLLEIHGSKTPLIIAGSTGSVSFGKKLIKAISQQKNGFVILYGLTGDEFAEENHPQFFLNQLLKFLEVEAVENIAEEKFLLSPQDRQKLLSLMMLPSKEVLKWQNISQFLDVKKTAQDLLQNFSLIETKNEIEEAKIIALALADKQKKSAIITNNEKLVSLLKLEFEHLGLPFNDARNLNIFNSKIINFLTLILELKESDFNSHTLLALLKNPLCFYSQEKELLTELEINILRADRSITGLEGIRRKLKNHEKLSVFFEDFYKDFNHSLIKAAEKLSKKTWLELLQNEPAQVEIFEFFEKLKIKNHAPISVNDFKVLLSQISYFEKSDAMAPIQILSTIEARLLNFDLVIIASLNEGDFPQIEMENWLGKKIKKDLEIDRALKKVGQSAYDFCGYLSNKNVILTRCKSSNGVAVIESPFLLKFKTICKKLAVNLPNGENYFARLKNSNRVSANKIKAPQPKPKKEFRPQKISITEISKLISDPYFIYAKKILRLRELEKIDFEPGYAEFGSFVHEALEQFIQNPEKRDFSKNFDKYFLSEEAKLIWWPKFENIFNDFLKRNEQFLALRNIVEIPVRLRLGAISISGKVDRVMIDDCGNAEIFDYKTGTVPTAKSVTAGSEPQLTIAALALLEEILKDEKISGLNYWKLSATNEGEITKVVKKPEEIEILIAAAKAGLERLFAYFADEENAYNATENLRFNEYKNLSRIEEFNK